MATTANQGPVAHSGNNSDPFVTNPQDPHRQRYSAFDSNLFSLYTSGSTSQAKRALEAHLAETERRLQETSQLGTVLVQQRKELGDRLKEVQAQADDNDIGPELRKKLVELERECNEVSKDTARVFIPKSRVPSGESADSSATGATVFSNDATPSPSKITAPSARKQRNHQVSRIQDIKLATDISSSLLQQLREVQAALAEKEELIRIADTDKSKLEIEVEGLSQRLRAMDESEQRYKDENWSLETQAHEYVATIKSTAEREQKLSHTLDLTKSEKLSLERELEELRQAHTKLSEDHALNKKHHESEVSGFRRNVSVGESERSVLQRKVDELTTQNQELARAVAYRARIDEQASARDHTSETEDADLDRNTPDHSPPPSPSKATPRHGQLESETLKSSLLHSHRMIQNLKNNIHREKTEKMELKRLLQDARDELDQRNANGANSAKQKRKGKDVDVFKKPARPERLGGQRSSKEEVLVDEPDWEDHDGEESPSRPSGSRKIVGAWPASSTDTGTDAFETATEQSDAFETANEREGVATETDAFHTGAETLDGDSSDLTETEGTAAAGLIRQKRPAPLASSKPGDRASYMSTASTSADDLDYDDVKTPVQAAHPKYRIKINRGNRRSTPARSGSEVVNSPESFKDSPASFASDSSQPAKRTGPSLFAELGDLSAEESDEEDIDMAEGTPSRSTFISSPTSPEVHMRRSINETVQSQSETVPSLPMVDAEVMTEPWEPEQSIISTATSAVGAAIAGGVGYAFGRSSDKDDDTATLGSSQTSDATTGLDASTITQIASPVPAKLSLSPIGTLSSEPIEAAIPKYSIAPVQSLQTEPVEAPKSQPVPLGLSSVSFGQQIEPLETKATPLAFAAIQSNQQTVPTDNVRAPLTLSSVQSGQHTEPSHIPKAMTISSVHTLQDSGPEELETPPVPVARSEQVNVSAKPQTLVFSGIHSQQIEPIASAVAEPSGHIGAAGVLASGSSVQDKKQSEHLVSREPEPKSAGGFLGSMLEWGKGTAEPEVAEDGSKKQRVSLENNSRSVTDDNIVENGVQNPVDALAKTRVSGEDSTTRTDPEDRRVPPVSTLDEETQTSLSAEEIDRMLRTKHAPPPVLISTHQSKGTTTQVRSNSSSPRRAANAASPTHDTGKLPPTRRPGSAGSSRSRAGTPPPLPPDHREVIAAAQRTSTPAGTMGPPMMPASAYKKDQFRPRTPVVAGPSQAVSPTSKTGTTPRARPPTIRSEISAPSTRRSSISSFASEIDQRFNIPRATLPDNFDPSTTDPRMIQAITQTMIGEYLWKYTRKAGRGEMSEKRHRRFFWVHPYTRTLYWSEQDPSTAGRAQLKAKSVAIEAVQVVTDDNPMPPGLHRKSIIVITPGRSIKFTATTGQRHETWFNALSYLLLRTSTERDGEEHITAEDVDEFNPSYARSGSRQTGRSHMSMSSQHTTVTRHASPQRAQYPSLTSRTSVGSQRMSSNSTSHTPSQPHNSVSSRLSSISGMFRPGRASFADRRSRSSVRDSSLYDATTVHDSAEDLRQVIEQQEREADRLENVRACCDGKHDVAHLSRNSRHSSLKGRHTSFGSMSRSARGRSLQPQQHLHHHDEVAESSHDAK